MKTPNSLKRIVPYFWSKHNLSAKLIIVFSAVLLVAAKLLAVYVPIYFQQTIDMLNGTLQATISVSALIIMYGVVRLLSTALNDVREILFSRVLYRAIRILALEVFNHLHSLSLRFHLDRQTGAVTRYIEQGIQSMERLIQFSTFGFFPTVVEILLVWGFLLYLFPVHFFLIIFITIGLYVVCTYIITNYRTRVLRERNQFEANSNQKALDSLLNYETVKYFGNEVNEATSYDDTLINYERISVKLRESLSLLNVAQGIIAGIGLIVCMYFASMGVANNTLSLGEYVMIHAYLIQLYIPLGNLGFMYREMREAFLRLNTMMDVLKAEPDIKDCSNPEPVPIGKMHISFENVDFGYVAERQILKAISLDIKEGQTVALVGESGSGKSTITRLLFRFYDVNKGSIKLNGLDIRSLSQAELRRMIAVVPQDTVLFNESLEYNIRYGKIELTVKDVHEAIKKAHLNHFIEQLPHGLKTAVGERGLKLSGGEKQRVAIARALLKNPKIFIFDESTSSLDSHTEKEIQHNLIEISKGKTTLIIAHRLSTIVNADQILVMDRGRILERGTHADLLNLNGKYASMWYQQTQKQLS